ncbi:MAG: TonB family protein, partial [Rhodothermales bacterium]
YEAGGRQGPWTDVYGSAATLFRMLTGHVLPAASRRLEHDEVPALLHQADGLPDALCHLLEQALSLDSARRPRSAQAFRQQLLDALKKRADPVAPASSVAQTPEPEPEAPPSEPPQAAMEEKPVVVVEAEAPVAVDEAPGVVEGREAAQVEEQGPVAVEPEIPVPFEEELVVSQEPEVISVVAEREDQAAQEVAALAVRAQAVTDADPRRKSGPQRQRSDAQAKRSRRGVPVLAALAVVVLVALSGAYVLMQNEGSEVAQFAHFKAQGDSLFAMANYIEAKTQYEHALAALPNNEYVTNRLDETQQRLAEVSNARYGHYLAQGDALYAQGDSLLNVGNTLEALSSFAEANKAFYEALRYQPSDSIVLEKGRLTAEGMQAALSKNREQTGQPASAQAEQDPGALRQQLYNSYRQQGDELFARGEYTAAREKFSKALKELPRNDYATAKIEEMDRFLEAAGREEQFQQLLEQGASLNEQGRYTEARIVFRQAQDLKPGHLQAYQGLTHADSMLAVAQRAREYRRFRDEGDALLRQNKPDEALASYQKTLFFKPDDAYAKQRIREIQQPLDENQPQAQPPQEPQQQPEPAPNVPKGDIHNVVDQAPELIGGLKVLHNMVNYPESARRQEIEGRVYVQFILTEKGQVEDAEVIRGIGGGCDEEALRVVQEARFIPGKIAGKPVRVRHTLFITFKLN